MREPGHDQRPEKQGAVSCFALSCVGRGRPIRCALSLNKNSAPGRMGLSGERSGQERKEYRQNGNTDAHERAELDSQLLLHFLDVTFQGVFQCLEL